MMTDNQIRLRNNRRGPIVGTDMIDADDGTQRNVGAETRYTKGTRGKPKDGHATTIQGETNLFDADNPCVKILARAGDLVPVDKDGEKWLAQIRKEVN
jgi:hypothetical protein